MELLCSPRPMTSTLPLKPEFTVEPKILLKVARLVPPSCVCFCHVTCTTFSDCRIWQLRRASSPTASSTVSTDWITDVRPTGEDSWHPDVWFQQSTCVEEQRMWVWTRRSELCIYFSFMYFFLIPIFIFSIFKLAQIQHSKFLVCVNLLGNTTWSLSLSLSHTHTHTHTIMTIFKINPENHPVWMWSIIFSSLIVKGWSVNQFPVIINSVGPLLWRVTKRKWLFFLCGKRNNMSSWFKILFHCDFSVKVN